MRFYILSENRVFLQFGKEDEKGNQRDRRRKIPEVIKEGWE